MRSVLALGSVNRLWREAFHLSRISHFTIPVALSSPPKRLEGCLRLSRRSPLALTLQWIPNKTVTDMLEAVRDRLVTLRMSCSTSGAFVKMADRESFMTSLKTLEVHANAILKKDGHWLRTPPAQLASLRLVNFAFSISCVLPSTLSSLVLEFTETGCPFRRSPNTVMHLGDLVGVLSHLPQLETLRVDLRYMTRAEVFEVDQAKLSKLGHLTVRSRYSNVFSEFVAHLSCPSLERAHLILDLLRASMTDVGDALRAASAKLAELTLTRSYIASSQHIYLDDRAQPDGIIDALSQTTVAVTNRVDATSLATEESSIARLASTAVFLLTVTRPVIWERPETRDPSSVMRLILEGLPELDASILTVHFHPGKPEDNCYHSDVQWVISDLSFLQHVASARCLNWHGDGDYLAEVIRLPDMFLQLNHLVIGLPQSQDELPARLDEAIGHRKERVQAAVSAEELSVKALTKHRRLAWKTSVLSPDAKKNVTTMFDELLDTVGRRVL